MKLRDLTVAKRYRDTVKKWGEPNVSRKRTIIAPPMSEATTKDVSIRPGDRVGRNGQSSEVADGKFARQIETIFNELKIDTDEIGYDKASLSKEFADYQIWLQKKKNLRKDLNSTGLNDKWLQSKGDLTELERRVLDKLSPKDSNKDDDDNEIIEDELHVIPTPPPLSKAQQRLLPLLQQPIPVALSIIAEYCHENKLRLLDLYKEIDKDKDWLISRNEVRKIIKANQIPLTDAQLEDMIIALDVDNNDQLDYRELAQGVEAYKIDERWQKIRELMKIMELHQEASKSRKKKFSQTTGENLRKTIRSARRGLTHKDVYDDSGDSDSSMDQYLQLPTMDTNEKSYSLATKARERRMKKHRERKEKTIQKQKQIKSKSFQPSTMDGITGEMKDRYAEKTVNQMNESLDMMHTIGIPVKEDALKRVMLFPFDKSIDDCKESLRQSGASLVSNSQFGQRFAYLCNAELGGGKAQEDPEHGKANRKNRRSRRKDRNRRSQRVFWPDTTYSQLSAEQLGRKTPQESVFTIVRS